MNRLLFTVCAVLTGLSFYASAEDELTGDTKLACEAILCLSTNTRPTECAPSIRKFFSIHASKPWKTIQERKNFLALCPSSKDNGMPEYKDLLANNAEKCSPDELNRYLFERKTRKVNNKQVFYYRISNKLPSYCEVFYNHEYNDSKPRYVGSDEWIESYLWEKNKGQYGHWK
ncbi:MAG TPA: TrbM/KikA/MpfK family conjugal transfer protein [Arsenophonus nasoniae]|uniref:TrbM/KikA/MpfK family conjugal transfer protein n=1 Tax=Arsenophonus nasoniae TaxID=638 RepID=UPI0038790988